MVENNNNLGGGDAQHIAFGEISPAEVFQTPVRDRFVSGDVHAADPDGYTPPYKQEGRRNIQG